MTTHDSASSPLEPELEAAIGEDEGELPPDAASALGIIQAQRAAVRDAAAPDSRLILLAWGLAWLVGNLALFWTARGPAASTPAGWAFAVYFTLLGLAAAFTITHVVRRSSGVVGPSGLAGAMFGWAWTTGFLGVFLIMRGLERAGAGDEIIHLGWIALSCLLVGVLYLAGGAMWHSKVMYALGMWIVLVGGTSTLAGLPGSYLVMALAGGGGFLVGALVMHAWHYRSAR
jgi:hypothetical protein